jgi:hypothetical protein
MNINDSKLLNLSPLSILICDKHQRVTWCNVKFLEQSGFKEPEVINHFYASLPIEAIDKQANLVQLFGDNNNQSKFHYWLETYNIQEGSTVHYFALVQENTLKVTSKRPNWVEFLDYEVSRSRRYDNPLCLLKLHVIISNQPSTVLDELIHQTIRNTLTDELRWADMIGNTNQGSYLMILPETPPSALDQLKSKISKAISAHLKLISTEISALTIFGSTSWKKHDDSQKILKRTRNNLVSELEKAYNKSTT